MKWKMALRNLSRNRRRNFISGVAIAFGCSGLILLGSYIVRTERYLRVNTVYVNHTGHVSLYKKDGLERYLTRPKRYTLNAEDQKGIRDILAGDQDVEFMGHYLLGIGLASNGCSSTPFLATGVERETDARVRSHPQVLKWASSLVRVSSGKPISGYSEAERPDAITVTGRLATILGKDKVHDDVPNASAPHIVPCNSPESKLALAKDADIQLVARTFGGDFSAVDARIVSHHSTGLAFAEETGLISNLSLLQKLYDTDRLTYVGVFLKEGVSVGDFVRRLTKKIDEKGLAVSAYPYSDERVGLFYVGVMNFLYTMASFFLALTLGMISITLVNFLTLGILERKREIGTLRAIGFGPGDIIGLLIRESTALTILGMIGGLLFSLGCIEIVNSLDLHFKPPGIAGSMPFRLTASVPLCVSACLLIGAISLFTAWMTLKRKSREGIVTLLAG